MLGVPTCRCRSLRDHAGEHQALARQVWRLLSPDESARAEVVQGKHSIPALIVYGALTLDPPDWPAHDADIEIEENYSAVAYETLPDAPQDDPGMAQRHRGVV